MIGDGIKVRLVISSKDVIPAVITGFLGVTPSQTWLRGETVTPGAKIVHQEHGWVLSVQSASEIYAECLVDQLIDLVPAGRLREFHVAYASTSEIELAVVAAFSVTKTAPSISLTSSQVAFLYSCGGSFDVDLYPS
jgi:hypothetical protein